MVLTFFLCSTPLGRRLCTEKNGCLISDNGILGLFLIDDDEKLLENIVAIQLNRLYRNTKEETRLYYYNRGCEIDFCVPEAKLAVQVSCEISKTYDREVGSLEKFLAANPDYRGILITMENEKTISVKSGNSTRLEVASWHQQFT